METVKNEEKEKNGGSKRSRIFNFTQQMVHPKTGESLLNEEQIKKIFVRALPYYHLFQKTFSHLTLGPKLI